MSKFDVLIKALMVVKNWPLYLADYLKVIKGRVTYTLIDGSTYTLRANTNDRNIFNEVLLHKMYNPPGFEINKGDIVVDIGAHVGIFSTFAAKDASKVYSFEPFSENFELLLINKKNNKRDNIIVYNKAVYSQAGKKTLFLDKDNKGGHSFYQDYLKNRQDKIETETISLQDVFLQNGISKVNFLKIDCEGSEYDILFNCPKEVLSKVEKISMEYHTIDDNHNVTKLQSFLEENGFTVTILNKIQMLYSNRLTS